MLRRRVRRWRSELDPALLQRLSDALCDHVLASEPWQRAQTVACFVSMGREVQTAPLLASDKRIVLPRVEGRDQPLRFCVQEGSLVRSAFGVLEPGPDAIPVPLAEVDLVLMPGLAVDAAGRRLGFGGGFYDRTLQGQSVPRVMLVLSEMVLAEVPARAHDQRVHGFFTEHGLTVCDPDALAPLLG